MNKIIIGAGLLLATASAAMAQQGSVNAYTPAQRAAAEAAVRAAGFTPGAVSYAQAGAIFINGTKNGEGYMITVGADGKVYPGIPSKPYAGNPNAPVTPAGRGGRGGGGGE